MVVKSEYLDFILEQLSGAGRITSRRMFGGFGLYADDVFFAIISRDVLYFKVGDGNRTDYAARDMRQFQPLRDKPHLSMSYYEVPADILEDADECAIWVRRAVAAALETKPARARRKPAAKRVAAKPTCKPRS